MNQYQMDLLHRLLDEQRRTNELLAALVAASKSPVASPAPVDDDDEDAPRPKMRAKKAA